MRMILVAASLALLAACGGGASNNSSGNGAAADGASAAPTLPTDPELIAMRASGINGCTQDVSRNAAPGTDVPRLCTCAVDRLMVGKTAAQLRQTGGGNEREALDACAAQLGITLPARPGASAAPAAPAPETAEPAEPGNSAQ